MCGIAGFVDSTGKNDRETLIRITDCMSHRGPDDSGYFYLRTPEFSIGLGHRRLSILDISSLGHQPMEYEDWIIVFNGEIYNFAEIKVELENLGCSFRSGSDTEVVLAAFHKWGIGSVNKFNGMFAFAIYNRISEELILVRDRTGVKPLYYFFDGVHFVFASELKPIMDFPGFKKEINADALNLFLFHGYIAAPRSIFKNVFKIEPGKYLVFKDRKVSMGTYWDAAEKFKERKIRENMTETEAVNELDLLLSNSVKYRMIADVPLGCFLSGGFDSSLIAAQMQKLSARPIDTFSIGFHEKKYNEAPFAKEVAKHLGTHHQEEYFSIEDAKKIIPEIPEYYDEPFADSSQLPSMLLSRFARKNVKVVLSGDAGDELFCGYGRYDSILKYRKFKGLSSALRLTDKFIPLKELFWNVDRKLVYLFYLNSNANIINSYYLSSETALKNLVRDHTYKTDENYFKDLDLSDNIQEANMLQDLKLYLPGDIWTKVDRATMSVGLEGREPFIDHRIIEWSFNLPHHFKYRNHVKKYILRQLTYRYVPKQIMDRPKMGFGVPVYQWLHGDLDFLLKEFLSDHFIAAQNIFRAEAVSELLNKFRKHPEDEFYSLLIWHLLVFQMWYKKYLA